MTLRCSGTPPRLDTQKCSMYMLAYPFHIHVPAIQVTGVAHVFTHPVCFPIVFWPVQAESTQHLPSRDVLSPTFLDYCL